jgi:hypothetical protein
MLSRFARSCRRTLPSRSAALRASACSQKAMFSSDSFKDRGQQQEDMWFSQHEAELLQK